MGDGRGGGFFRFSPVSSRREGTRRIVLAAAASPVPDDRTVAQGIALRRRFGQGEMLPLLALLLVAGTFHYLTLLRTPMPFVDESYYASQAWGIIHAGLNYGPLQPKVFSRFDGYANYYPWLGPWIESLAIRLLGLSLESVRLVSLSFGLVLLAVVYGIGLCLGGSRLGLLAAALLSVSSRFIYSAHLARPDVIVATLGYGAVALVIIDRRDRWPIRALLAGLMIGFAVDIHPNAVIYAPAVGVLYLLQRGWSAFRSRDCWCFALGVLAGLVYFVAAHILPSPATYSALNYINFGATKTPPILALDPRVWRESFADTALALLRITGATLPLLVAAIVSFGRLASIRERTALALFVVLAFEFLAVVAYKPDWYDILLAPAVDVLLAMLLLRWFGPGPRRPVGQRLVRIGVLILMVSTVGFNVASAVSSDAAGEYGKTVAAVKAEVPAGATVMGNPALWFGLPGVNWVTQADPSYYQRYAPAATLAEAFQEYHPDYLIADRFMDFHVVDNKDDLPQWAQIYQLPKTQLNQLLHDHGELVAAFPTKSWGTVRIYRLRWK